VGVDVLGATTVRRLAIGGRLALAFGGSIPLASTDLQKAPRRGHQAVAGDVLTDHPQSVTHIATCPAVRTAR
jgi:hypothetical protein